MGEATMKDTMLTGTISSLKTSFFWACPALFCEAVANLSCCSLEISHCLATFSAKQNTAQSVLALESGKSFVKLQIMLVAFVKKYQD